MEHVQDLLNILLSTEYRNISDAHGEAVVPKSDVYNDVSDKLSGRMKPRYIYVILKQNRYRITEKLWEFHCISSEETTSEFQLSNTTINDSAVSDTIECNITFPYKTWLVIRPENMTYAAADRSGKERNYKTLIRQSWSNVVYDALYKEIKLPCALSFKRCTLSDTGFHVTIAGVCHECNSTFHGCIVNEPLPHTPVVMECTIKHFDESVKHSKKRQLKGERRTKIAKLMADGNTMACTYMAPGGGGTVPKQNA